MSYLRRDKTKPVMNVHLRAAPMPKTSTVHRNVDTSVRYTGIGLCSARARPGGGGGAPGDIFGPRGSPKPPPRPAHPAGTAAYHIRAPCGTAAATARRCRPRHVHCACCGGCSCPQGSPGGHRTPEPPPQCTLLTRTSTPAARASCPAHGHYGTAPGAAASEQGRLRAIRGTQEIPEGPLEASKTHPSTPQSHEPANQGEFQKNRPLKGRVRERYWLYVTKAVDLGLMTATRPVFPGGRLASAGQWPE